MPPHVPLLDLAALRAGDARELAALRTAAHGVGFFQVRDAALGPERIQAVLAAAAGLLALPEPAKAAGASRDSPHFRGWTRPGSELTRGRPDQREQIDFGRDEPALPLSPAAPGLRLRGPNRWPEHPDAPAHVAVVDRWWRDLEAAGADLLVALLASLGLPADALDPLLTGDDGRPAGHLHGKLLRYPSRPVSDGQLDGQGVGAHKDYGFLALLVQDGVGGLQAELPDGGWVEVEPRPDAVVVNLGEVLELLTGGYLVATPHRVLSPTTAERHSVAVFLGPRLDVTVRPLDLPPALRGGARGVSADPDNPLLADYGANSLKGWLRAHPETARRHHPDLLEPPTARQHDHPERTPA